MTETLVYGSLSSEGMEVVSRGGRFFVRYDAGAHQIAWREDELSADEFDRLRSSKTGEYDVIIALQRRLHLSGEDPNRQNWAPGQNAG
jgi:hypothetical protein